MRGFLRDLLAGILATVISHYVTEAMDKARVSRRKGHGKHARRD